jgi:hypothetical protein
MEPPDHVASENADAAEQDAGENERDAEVVTVAGDADVRLLLRSLYAVTL